MKTRINKKEFDDFDKLNEFIFDNQITQKDILNIQTFPGHLGNRRQIYSLFLGK